MKPRARLLPRSKRSSQAQLLEGRANLWRLKQEIPVTEVRWERYPRVAACATARSWLQVLGDLGLAANNRRGVCRFLGRIRTLCEGGNEEPQWASYLGSLRDRHRSLTGAQGRAVSWPACDDTVLYPAGDATLRCKVILHVKVEETALSTLEQLVAEAIRLGADSLDVEYKDQQQEVTAMRGQFGVGIASLPSLSAEAEDLRRDLYGIAKKQRHVKVGGGQYELRARVHFGEDAFSVRLRRL